MRPIAALAIALAAVPLAAGTAGADEFRDSDLSLTTDKGLQWTSVTTGAEPGSAHYAEDRVAAGLSGVDLDSKSSNSKPTILGTLRSTIG